MTTLSPAIVREMGIIIAAAPFHTERETVQRFNNLMRRVFPFMMAQITDLTAESPCIEFFCPVNAFARSYRTTKESVQIDTVLAYAKEFFMGNVECKALLNKQETHLSQLIAELADGGHKGNVMQTHHEAMMIFKRNFNLAVLIGIDPDSNGHIDTSGAGAAAAATCHPMRH